MSAARAALGANDLLAKSRDFDIVDILSHVDQALVSARRVQTVRDEAAHPEMAHVA
jgi:hypothetical protein